MRVCPACQYRGAEAVCPNDGLRTVDLDRQQGDERDLIGRIVDRKYRVEALLGRGGMGAVYRARHLVMQHQLALKVIRHDVRHDVETLTRFFNEARACSRLSHPNTIRVSDFGVTDDGWLFMAMELLRGRDLAAALAQDGPFAPARAAHVGRQVCLALDEAHRAGLVHRDLKPSNVFLIDVHLQPDFVKVIDFGMAKAVGHREPGAELTSAGVILGTPRYISPEQARALPVDGRADLYALGVVLFELLTGELPFAAETASALLVAHATETPRPLPERIPRPLRQLVAELLAKSPEERPESAAAVAERLRPLAEETGHAAPPEPPADGPARPAVQAETVRWEDFAQTPAAPRPADSPAEAHPERPSPRPRRLRWGLAAALALALAAAAGAWWGLAGRPDATRADAAGPPLATARPSRDAPSTPASAADPAAPLPMTALPRPATGDAESLAAWDAGLQALRDGAFVAGRQHLERLVARDPSVAAAWVRLAALRPAEEARAAVRKALELRGALDARNAALLHALEPLLSVPSDPFERARRLRAAAEVRPGDAELAALLGDVLVEAGEPAQALAALDRALANDPRYGWALHVRGEALAYLGRREEALADFARALALTPTATGALNRRHRVWEQEGRCDLVEADARAWIAASPDDPEAYVILVEGLAGQDRPLPTIEAALRKKWARLPEGARERVALADHARLALLVGRFDVALRHADELARRVEADSDEVWPARAVRFQIEAWRESGRLKEAAQAAEDFLLRRDAWLLPARAEDFTAAAEVTPLLEETRYRARLIGRAEYRDRIERYCSAWRERARAPLWQRYIWFYAWAAPASDEPEAWEALAAEQQYAPLPPWRPTTLADAHEGKVRLLAGDVEGALPLLRRATRTCLDLWDPLHHTRAHRDLGVALAARGDVTGACAAWQVVIDRWGAAEPRSITAEDVRERMTALGCPAR